MAAHGQGAEGGGLTNQGIGAFDNRRGAGELALFHRQPFTQGGHALVRAPTVADETLVQVNVAIDEPRQRQQPFKVDGFAGRLAGALRADMGDAPVLYGNVQGQAIGVDGIDELTVIHGRAFFPGLSDDTR
ncbi:hypothetical protein D3C73_1241030 [compost metagenome]